MALAPGQLLNNRYRIEKLLGQGGFGAVYKAWDLNLDGPVALKESLDASAAGLKQFKLEARLLFNLRHPNLPKVHDSFSLASPDGEEASAYLVMEFIEGEDLQSRLEREGALHEAQVVDWLRQVCSALAYLHRQSPPIIHRDIKPANIRITSQGEVFLVDFGIAKLFDPAMSTTLGARAATPGYAPPEQFGRGTTDAQSDLYALGATAYHMLSGTLPPPAMDVVAGNTAPARPLQRVKPEISDEVSAAVERAMKFNRAERWKTAEEFREAMIPPPAPPLPREERVPPPVPPLEREGIIPPTAAPVAVDGRIPPTLTMIREEMKKPPQPLDAQEMERRMRPWRWIGKGEALALLAVFAVILVILNQSMGDFDIGEWITGTLVPRLAGEGTELPEATPTLRLTPAPTSASRMVLIPAGEFQMGSTVGGSDEKPLHTVRLDAFYIDIYEVTNQQYAEFLTAQGNQEEGGSSWLHAEGSEARIHQEGGEWLADVGYENFPAANVTWFGARAFCTWLGGDLPGEAQWEKAARGGLPVMVYPWGNDGPICSRGAFNGAKFDDDGTCNDTGPEKVGSYSANGYGVFDMAGNVWEWALDWYAEAFYTSSPLETPFGPQRGTYRVIRGGAWNLDWSSLRVANRDSLLPGSALSDTGFRCARPH